MERFLLLVGLLPFLITCGVVIYDYVKVIKREKLKVFIDSSCVSVGMQIFSGYTVSQKRYTTAFFG